MTLSTAPSATLADTSILHLPSTPETVVWGYLAVDRAPALRVRSGEVVRIDTVSGSGLRGPGDPVAFFGAYGVTPEAVLPDASAIYSALSMPEGAAGHVLTGPVFVEEAQPGDVLEVRVLDIGFRVPYGVNRAGPGFGALPHLLPETVTKLIHLDLERRVARFSAEIEIPLRPFMGVMAVAPPPSMGFVSSRPPGVYGGNMDLNELTIGATVYLPVHKEGACFLVGDGHALQGDGEVTGTAIETSLTPVLQFILHKGMPLTWPRAETATHYISMGMDESLDRALEIALQEAITFLQREKTMSAADAYALASLAVDFEIAEAVNQVKCVHGMIPKSIFKSNPPYWAEDGERG